MNHAIFPFHARHIGPNNTDQMAMLSEIGASSIDELIEQTVPESIRMKNTLTLPAGVSEAEALLELSNKMNKNKIFKSFLGVGYYGCYVPPVIQRNLFENPAWYTAYTPYQAEISQGRLEMLFNFQTLVSELTGLPIVTASLLDEGTAVAEAVGIAWRHHRSVRMRLVIAGRLHPQTIDVVSTRAEPLGIQLVDKGIDDTTFAVIIPWPDTYGAFDDYNAIIAEAKANAALVIFVADPLALLLSKSPAEMGADIAVGSMQRYGVPMGFGGPHAAYCAVTTPLTRLMPGRIVGQTIDSHNRKAYRLALQTREQHIRRDKATSNICTAQALLANMAAAYAIWHGPEGLNSIAERIHILASRLHQGANERGLNTQSDKFFDTVTIALHAKSNDLIYKANQQNFLIRKINENTISISFDETSSEADLYAIGALLNIKIPETAQLKTPYSARGIGFLTQPVFHENRSETQMMRYLRHLSDKDLALDRAMIPLGSCTMKLNAAAEMMPVSWPNIANLHPFAPHEHTQGYLSMIGDLENWLGEITGFDAVSLQPNAGSQGEYAGLLAIKRYHSSQGNEDRDICLIPASAHGTNPASAAMAGLQVVVVKCTQSGDIDISDLKEKAEHYKSRLAVLMITYPSTHGVFEKGIREICSITHQYGGQVYFDGANLNALVGIVRPGDLGADVCHMNLHKTFCIPHGGGGPGVGPIGVKEHLRAFLPGHVERGSSHAVASAPFGSASILPITWMYIRMMGADGLKHATKYAILSANYIAHRLRHHYPILYQGNNGRVAHECILDTRVCKTKANISVDDIAKRLMDYGFHAPTMSWPVAGTLMVEPTESEPKTELDRFCDAMISIAYEVAQVEKGNWPLHDNPLVNAPHTATECLEDNWSHPYSRNKAAFPEGLNYAATKYWPPVSRIDNVTGDRNLVCSCPPLETYINNELSDFLSKDKQYQSITA